MLGPTDEELHEYVANINYELLMLRHARDLETSGRWEPDDRAGWLATEAALVHCRNLIDFFRGTNASRAQSRPGDVIAWDYARVRGGWDPRRTWDLLSSSGTPADLSRRINTRVMHLGRGRNTIERVDFVEVANAIDAIWRAWRKTLNPRWQRLFSE